MVSPLNESNIPSIPPQGELYSLDPKTNEYLKQIYEKLALSPEKHEAFKLVASLNLQWAGDRELPFSNLTPEEMEFSARTAKLTDQLNSELDFLLFQKESQVDAHLRTLDSAHKDQKIVKTMIDVQRWANDYAYTAKDAVHEGMNFLEGLIPHELLVAGSPLKGIFEYTEAFTKIGGDYLGALASGSLGLALIFKGKLLNETKKAVLLSNKEYINRKKEMEEEIKKLSPDNREKYRQTKTAENDKFKKERDSLKIKLKKEMEEWKKDKKKFTKTTVETSLLSLKHISMALEGVFYYSKHITQSLYVASSTIGFITTFSTLRTEIKSFKTFNNWVDKFHRWQQKNTVSLTPPPKEHVLQTPTQSPPLNPPKVEDISRKQYSEEFDDEINHIYSRVDLKNTLQHYGYDLGENTSTIEFKTQLQDNPELKNAIMPGYVKYWEDDRRIRQNRTYEFDFSQEMTSFKTIEEVNEKLQEYGIKLPKPMTLTEFQERIRDNTQFHNELLSTYSDFQEALKAFDAAINEADHLYAKRKAIKEKKVFLMARQIDLLLPKVKELKEKQFAGLILDEEFESWFGAQNPLTENDAALKDEKIKRLLSFYVDHQETLEKTTKNALAQMIAKKQDLDASFMKLKLAESSVFFSLSALMLALSGAMWVSGLATIPVGGLGLVVLGLSIPSIILTAVFYLAGVYNNYRRNPELRKEYTAGTSFKIAYTTLKSTIAEYQQANKQKKLLKTAEIIRSLHLKADLKRSDPVYERAYQDYIEAKKQFNLGEQKVNKWNKKLESLQERLNKAAWKDFVSHAKLQIGEQEHRFDSLVAFDNALQEMDLSLIPTETKELLEVHLGINMKELKSKISQDPLRIRNALQKFFILDESEYVNFMKQQEMRLDAKMVRTT